MRLRERRDHLVTSNYVLLESLALLGCRIGVEAVRQFDSRLVPLLSVVWVNEQLHRQALSALLVAGHRDLSLVDCTRFQIMRDADIDRAFAYDAHFRQQGFDLL